MKVHPGLPLEHQNPEVPLPSFEPHGWFLNPLGPHQPRQEMQHPRRHLKGRSSSDRHQLTPAKAQITNSYHFRLQLFVRTFSIKFSRPKKKLKLHLQHQNKTFHDNGEIPSVYGFRSIRDLNKAD